MTGPAVLPRRAAVIVFLAFAFAYFLSALVRAVTATLAPTLAQEFSLQASDLGLLAGGYFLGFAATQLPLGTWLDRHGPRKVALGFLGVAVVGSLVFSVATGFSGLLAGRVLCGAGVSACLMAPLTGYRRGFEPTAQMRANSWMLMTGSLGMVASTLPVQWALPLVGWRPLFWGLAALIAVSMVVIAAWVPGWGAATPGAGGGAGADAKAAADRSDAAVPAGYAVVWRHPYFQRLAPLGFFVYGGMVAVQTLWAGPWMQRVAKRREALARRRIDSSRLRAMRGRKVLSSRWPERPPTASAASLPTTWAATWVTTSGMTGFTLPGMIEEPGWSDGRRSSPIPVRGPEPSRRTSFAILKRLTAAPRSAPESASGASCAPCAAKWSLASR